VTDQLQLDLTGEEWRPVVGYEGRYEVSSLGRVRSYLLHGSHSGTKKAAPSLLVLRANRHGYREVKLCSGRHRRTGLVHQLVADAFIGRRGEGVVVRHLDGNPANNSVANLAYGDQAENFEDSRRHGTVALGERCGSHRLTEDQVRRLRARRAEGASYSTLRREFGVAPSTAWQIVNGQLWRHVA
jgi:hypothetical protein